MKSEPLPTPRDLFSLEGRVALVTGAGSGIGAAVAATLAGAGAHVICAGRTFAKVEARAAAITLAGGSAEALAIDVTDENSVIAGFLSVAACAGRLDVLVNNAAIMPKHDFLGMSGEDWDAPHRTNLRGAFLATREGVKLMQAGSAGGSIINIASVAGLHAAVFGNAQYGATKAGLLALTRSVALEFAPDNIRCNAIVPGAVATEGGKTAAKASYPPRGPFVAPGRMLLGRIGVPGDIAPGVLYLASGASAYVTGQSVIVDGGLLIG